MQFCPHLVKAPLKVSAYTTKNSRVSPFGISVTLPIKPSLILPSENSMLDTMKLFRLEMTTTFSSCSSKRTSGPPYSPVRIPVPCTFEFKDSAQAI